MVPLDGGDAARYAHRVGHIERTRPRSAAIGCEARRGGLELVAIAAVEDDARTGAREPRAMANPRPRPPPVTSARRPVRSNGCEVAMVFVRENAVYR